MSRRTVYSHREQDPEFASAWDDALNQSLDLLEHRAFQLALEGEPRLIEFYLKSYRPERFRETARVEIDQRWCGVLVVPEKELKEP